MVLGGKIVLVEVSKIGDGDEQNIDCGDNRNW